MRLKVVFIPGLMGTDLWGHVFPGDKADHRMWPPRGGAEGVTDITALRLDEQGLSPHPFGGTRIPVIYPRQPNDIYGPLQEAIRLILQPDDFLALGYDWRLPTAVTLFGFPPPSPDYTPILPPNFYPAAQHIVDFVGDNPFCIVCHSNGETLANLAYQKFPVAVQNQCRSIISICGAAWGSWAPVQVFTHLDFWLELAKWFDSGGTAAARFVLGLGLKRTAVPVNLLAASLRPASLSAARLALDPILSSWGPLYELMPAPSKPAPRPDLLSPSQLYDNPTLWLNLPDFNTGLLAAAKELWKAQADKAKAPPASKWRQIVATGNRAFFGVKRFANGKSVGELRRTETNNFFGISGLGDEAYYVTTEDGDGRLTREQQTFATEDEGGFVVEAPLKQHAEIVADPFTIRAVQLWIQEAAGFPIVDAGPGTVENMLVKKQLLPPPTVIHGYIPPVEQSAGRADTYPLYCPKKGRNPETPDSPGLIPLIQ